MKFPLISLHPFSAKIHCGYFYVHTLIIISTGEAFFCNVLAGRINFSFITCQLCLPQHQVMSAASLETVVTKFKIHFY